MFFGAAETTAYDLRFRILDIPVRVHPLFWLVMLLISGQPHDLTAAFVFVACAFVSILVHELGHGITSRILGREPDGIVLYAMGGLCYTPAERQSPLARLLVLAAGPGAGFLLLAVVLVWGSLVLGIGPAQSFAFIGVGTGDPIFAFRRLAAAPPVAVEVFHSLLYINFWWGVLNLLPIWPLDGGQIAGVVLGAFDRRNGQRWAHILSIVTAGLLAYWFVEQERYLTAIWFGYFGYVNYQMLQSMQRSYLSGNDWGTWHR
jgi:membrane-associated protease RseP (regulator of RpoE activity)